jgi:hypothetical protein
MTYSTNCEYIDISVWNILYSFLQIFHHSNSNISFLYSKWLAVQCNKMLHLILLQIYEYSSKTKDCSLGNIAHYSRVKGKLFKALFVVLLNTVFVAIAFLLWTEWNGCILQNETKKLFSSNEKKTFTWYELSSMMYGHGNNVIVTNMDISNSSPWVKSTIWSNSY